MRLTTMEKRQIEENVRNLLVEYGYSFETDTYLDIVDFVTKKGFTVGNARLDENEDGFLAIQPEKPSKKIIGVNANRSFELKRFIIAHEFAHSVLHYQKGEIWLHRENKKGKNESENDADYFAAALLMPKDSFKKQYDELNYFDKDNERVCQKLARIYGVPLESVQRRIGEIS